MRDATLNYSGVADIYMHATTKFQVATCEYAIENRYW